MAFNGFQSADRVVSFHVNLYSSRQNRLSFSYPPPRGVGSPKYKASRNNCQEETPLFSEINTLPLFQYNLDMKKITLPFWITNPSIILRASLLAVLLVSACAPKTPDPNQQIRDAVASTLAAIPTMAPFTPPTPYPTSTPFSLVGLFCEYQFCIGHPSEIAYYDVLSQQNPLTPSNYSQGIIATYNSNLLIRIIWQFAPDTKDPQFLLDLILESDTRTGTMDTKLIRNMNVLYTAITTTVTPVLPYGGAAAWNCGDRVFAWKVYTPQAESAQPLFENTIARFTCGQ
jgi:hypothetical protein